MRLALLDNHDLLCVRNKINIKAVEKLDFSASWMAKPLSIPFPLLRGAQRAKFRP